MLVSCRGLQEDRTDVLYAHFKQTLALTELTCEADETRSRSFASAAVLENRANDLSYCSITVQ